jgi:hypothetical protein
MRVNPMTLSHDESTANTSSNAGTKPAIANQCAPESKSMYFTSEPTKQRSRLSLSRKQRMHWREQNEKQKSVKIDCKRKRGVDAGDNQVDEDALANKVSKVTALFVNNACVQISMLVFPDAIFILKYLLADNKFSRIKEI